jgi:hypothetical protein
MNGQEQPKSPEQVGQEQHDQFIRQLNKMKTRTLKRIGPQIRVLKKVAASARNTPEAREARKVLPSSFFVDKTALVRVPRTKAQRKARRGLAQ